MDRRTFLLNSSAASLAALFPEMTLAEDTGKGFELVARPGKANLYGAKGKPSDVWLYNDSLPGPTIRVRKGERVKVRFTNQLEQATSVHWHGIRIDNAMDGVSGLTQDPVEPGGSFEYDFIAPDAGTYWYHAHNMSWNQVPRGLSGALVVEDEEPVFAPERDHLLMLNDWVLNEDGVLRNETLGSMMEFSHAGRLGNWLTVNGQDLPDIPLVAGQWHRLRLVNTSSSRVLAVAPDRFGAKVIAYDGQGFDAPRDFAGTMQLAPAQRVDLAVRPDKPGTLPFEMMTGQPYTFANFQVSDGPGPQAELKLPPTNNLPEPDLNNARSLPLRIEGGAMGGMPPLTYEGEPLVRETMMEHMQFWGLNGVAGMSKEPMFTAKRGETIILESENATAFPHAMHIHGHHFRVLERDGVALEHPDWRDTVLSDREETVKTAFVADNPGKWLIHCHMLEHSASGMMTWFEVT